MGRLPMRTIVITRDFAMHKVSDWGTHMAVMELAKLVATSAAIRILPLSFCSQSSQIAQKAPGKPAAWPALLHGAPRHVIAGTAQAT